MREIDARGLSCSQLLLLVEKALKAREGGDQVRVLIDDMASYVEAMRFAKGRGYAPSVNQVGDEFHVII